jgi:hypothetical protein
MKTMSKPTLVAVAALSFLAATVAPAAPAHAQSIIKNPGDHPNYGVELEPHLDFGWANLYASNGFGAGLRAGIPIVQNGFIPTINNSIAISFGADILRYSGCYYGGTVFANGSDLGCGATYFVFPVTMQWNFWLSPRWSVFGEPGLYVYHATFDSFCDKVKGGAFINCTEPSHTGVGFAAYAGGRFHFNDKVALTLRVGYPTVSLGVSFLL